MIRLLFVCVILFAIMQVSCSSCDSDKDEKKVSPEEKIVDIEDVATHPKHLDNSLKETRDVTPDAIAAGLYISENELPEVIEESSLGPNGFGNFPACMSEAEIIKQKSLRTCPFTGVDTDYHCFTFDIKKEKNSAMLELWCKDGKLVRVLTRNYNFKTIHGISTNDDLAAVRSLYKDVSFFRGDKGQWIAHVQLMNMNFYLDDNTSEKPEDIDRFTKINSIEVLFPCEDKDPVIPIKEEEPEPNPHLKKK